MIVGKEVFGKFAEGLDDRDVEILKQLYLHQEEYGTGVTFNKFEKLMQKCLGNLMARQTLYNHINKLVEMGLVEKKRDEKSKLPFKPTYLHLTERSWKSLRLIQSTKLQEFIRDFGEIDMEGSEVSKITEDLINVVILSFGRLLKQCIQTDDRYMRTILFNITFDLIKQIFEHAISNAERNDMMKAEILEVIESTYKPYAEKYKIEL